MADTEAHGHGLHILMCTPDSTQLGSEHDATELIGDALSHDIDMVVIPAERLPDGFFTLSTRIAGGIIQQFVNYRPRLAIIGDISGHLDQSSALCDFVSESNQANRSGS